MKQFFINYCYQFITNHEKCDELKTKQLYYGLEAIYNMLTKFIFLFFLFLIFDMLYEYFLLLIIHGITKRYTYGLHAKTTLACWMTTIPIYVIGCSLIKFFSIPYFLEVIIWLCGLISFGLWAPADTPARPLIHEQMRKKQKCKAIIVLLLYLIFLFFIKDVKISNAICYSIIIQICCINPLTYKLTRTPFENYKLYYQKHGLNF